ncbi:MAG: FAD-binding protein [Verrucomicrobiia bacterium]
MNCIVLVKQVPDVSNIPAEAWDREKGTLKRGVLNSMLNPLDLQALTFANRLIEKSPDPSRVVCLSMGPPQAKETLLDCLSRGADEAVLLTDREFAGADTVATSYSLAQAVRKIHREILHGFPYIIVAGMQSVDGDTAQVPPQIAEDLGIEHIAYAEAFSFEPSLVVRRIGSRGIERVEPKGFPVLITTTLCMDPLYRTFDRSRKAPALPYHEWGAREIGASPERIGLKGSRTQVNRIFSPGEERAKECTYFATVKELVDQIIERYRSGDPSHAARQQELPYCLGCKQPTYRGEFWVYVEQEKGRIQPVSLELVGKAVELAKPLGEMVGAVLVGHEVRPLAAELFARGADRVYVADDPRLHEFLPFPFKKVVSTLVEHYVPQAFLFGATPLGRELAPRVAYASKAGLTADCTKLEIGDFAKGETRLVAVLKQTRPALGGNIMATIMTKDSRTQMATVRPGVMPEPTRDPSRTGELISCPVSLEPGDFKSQVLCLEPFQSKASLAEAEIIVEGGRGLRTKANYDAVMRPLAKALEKLFKAKTEVGASRMAVEEGFIGHEHQIGQTGQTVHPKLLVAVAISGAVQHISGMQNARIIIAINKDPQARIFGCADFGMVRSFETVLPELIEEIEGRASEVPRPDVHEVAN